jgi:SAM-dependent methyltransferase
MPPSDKYLQAALRRRSLSDDEFDCVYPPDIQRVSRRFWTPLAVAWRAAAWLDALHVTRVLDIGSGPGKFCVAAAAQAPNVAFLGVEQRLHLVEAARETSSRMRTLNARFAVGDATLARLDEFDAVYLFNPFAENVFEDNEQVDLTVELSLDRYKRDLRRVWAALAAARLGMIVVTYHGFGAPLPRGYECLDAKPAGSDRLCIWRKTREVVIRGRRLMPATEGGWATALDMSTSPDDEA